MPLAKVTRVNGGAVPRTVAAKIKPLPVTLAAGMQLPTEPCPVSTDIKDYTLLLYGQPGWGKTTLLSTFPDVAYFGTERGFKGIANVWAMGPPETGRIITTWDMMRRGVELLETSDRFENVAIDTVDRAYAMCMDWVSARAGVKHPDDKKDRGKTWNEVKDEFLNLLNRIAATGRGLYMASHVREETIERASGADYTRIGPSLTGAAARVVIAFVDFVFYGDYVGSLGSGMQRVLFTQGDELIVGKSRQLASGVKLPAVIALPENEAQDYEYIKAMFEGRLEGLNLGSLMRSGRTSKAVGTKINEASAASALANLQGRGVPAQG